MFSQAQMNQQKKKTSFAWAKYYEARGETADYAGGIIGMLQASGIHRNDAGQLERPTTLPAHITAEFMDMAEKLNKEHSCPVCFDLVNSQTIHITWCGHILCKGCIEALPPKPNGKKSCPICRKGV